MTSPGLGEDLLFSGPKLVHCHLAVQDFLSSSSGLVQRTGGTVRVFSVQKFVGAQYGAAMLVELCAPLIWQPENMQTSGSHLAIKATDYLKCTNTHLDKDFS